MFRWCSRGCRGMACIRQNGRPNGQRWPPLRCLSRHCRNSRKNVAPLRVTRRLAELVPVRKNNWTVGVADGQLSGTYMTFANEMAEVLDDGDNLRVHRNLRRCFQPRRSALAPPGRCRRHAGRFPLAMVQNFHPASDDDSPCVNLTFVT